MKDGKPNDAREPEIRRSASRRGGGPAKQRGFVERPGGRASMDSGFVERATARGHSGHGSESVRPHLRDQLRLKALLPTPFPPPEQQEPGKDEHHL